MNPNIAPLETSPGTFITESEFAMKVISLDAPNVRMVSRPADSGPTFELPLDLPPEIDQRDIEDLRILAKWYKSAAEFAEIDDIFCSFDNLKLAID